jgi:curved DNA-binding protein CbpA
MSNKNNYFDNYTNYNYSNTNSTIKSSNNNLYETLGLKVNCTKEEIKKAYKKLILKYHPDKTNEKTSEKFLEIKNAFDILHDDEKRDFYNKMMFNDYKNMDGMINLNNILNANNVLNINNLTQQKIRVILLNFFDSTDIDKILIIMIKKKMISNCNLEKLFCHKNFIKNLIDIDVVIDFTLYDLWFGIPKNINLERVTKNMFNELIYPFDDIQIYENEGEQIKLNNVIQNGNINIKINITDMKINNEQYYIYDNELYIIINKNRIKKNKFVIKFIDGNNYKFNLDKLNQIENKLGKFYIKKNFGLLNTDIEYLNNFNVENYTGHGNLFFIIIL